MMQLYQFNNPKKFTVSSNASGTPDAYTIIESYPGETAIIDGSSLNRSRDDQRTQGSVRVEGSYIKIRRLEVRNMPEYGIAVDKGSNVIVEGCQAHHNGLTGITGHHTNNTIFRHNIAYLNSDLGLGENRWNYDDGDNADGISIAYSKNSEVTNNTIYLNFDDGIDIWGSSNCLISRNKAYKNGYLDNGTHAGRGNGQGIKTGGQDTRENITSYNIVWKNYSNGIDISEATNRDNQYTHNTTWHNGYKNDINRYKLGRGYTFNPDTILEKNISSDDAVYFWSDHGIFIDNSWDREDHSWENPGSVPFINTTDPDSPDFLRPAKGSGYEDLGVYAGEK